jgi:hypothetical protein
MALLLEDLEYSRDSEETTRIKLTSNPQILPRTRLPNNEEEQPKYTDHAARSCWHTT